MGVTVRQKNKGKGQPWWVFIRHNNILRSKKVGDRNAAEAVASEVRRKLAMGELFLTPKTETRIQDFSTFAALYIESYAKLELKQNSWEGYQNIIDNHLLPAWGPKPIDQITDDDVRALLTQKIDDGLSFKTVQNIRVLVSGMFSFAIYQKLLSVNPATRVGKKFGRRGPRPDIKFLSMEEVARFLNHVQQTRPEHHTFFLTAFRTGMRLGELLGLAWEDIDMERRVLTITRSFTHGRFETPKSGKHRVVEMSDQLTDGLSTHKGMLRKQFEEGLPVCTVPKAISPRQSVHLVFPNKAGMPMDGDNLRHRVFREVTKELQLGQMRIHDIRHTFASLLLQQNAPLHYVKEKMGHASITTTVDIYGHLIPGLHREAINGLDAVCPPSANPPLRMAS
ncbi:MAG TPA: tyrosine-type recombinase/integrase [Phycisphaerae bacterium]|nr:tyrosine-type recombinase/integrase [Phycisphaerae bacterium]